MLRDAMTGRDLLAGNIFLGSVKRLIIYTNRRSKIEFTFMVKEVLSSIQFTLKAFSQRTLISNWLTLKITLFHLKSHLFIICHGFFFNNFSPFFITVFYTSFYVLLQLRPCPFMLPSLTYICSLSFYLSLFFHFTAVLNKCSIDSTFHRWM